MQSLAWFKPTSLLTKAHYSWDGKKYMPSSKIIFTDSNLQKRKLLKKYFYSLCMVHPSVVYVLKFGLQLGW